MNVHVGGMLIVAHGFGRSIRGFRFRESAGQLFPEREWMDRVVAIREHERRDLNLSTVSGRQRSIPGNPLQFRHRFLRPGCWNCFASDSAASGNSRKNC